MGSSGGGSGSAPIIPRYTNAPTVAPGGSPVIAGGGVPSFLPSDPGAMATGLTPQMLSAIGAMPAQAPQAWQPPAPTSVPAADSSGRNQLTNALMRGLFAQIDNRGGGYTGGYSMGPDLNPRLNR
jgi:hypothetical protein